MNKALLESLQASIDPSEPMHNSWMASEEAALASEIRRLKEHLQLLLSALLENAKS